MIFLLIMFIILTLMMVTFTIQNYRKYGTLFVPLFLTLLLIGGTVWSASKLPATIKQIKSRQDTTKKVAQLTASQRAAMQKSFENVSGSHTIEIPTTSAEDQQQALSLQETKYARSLDTAYQQIGDVSFDEKKKAFQLRLYAKTQLAESVSVVEAHPSQAATTGWQSFTNSLKTTSKTIGTAFKPGYTLELMGVNNSQNILYAAKDGKELINIAEQ